MLWACAATVIINLTAQPINKLDERHIAFAKKRCSVVKPQAPCLKRFIKVRPRVYRAICSGYLTGA